MKITDGTVRVGGQDIELTPQEANCLAVLVGADGAVVSRPALLHAAWGVSPDVATSVQTRTVDMTISRLRTKLGEAGDRIYTRRGFGYQYKAPR